MSERERALERLRALYAEVDELYADASCPSSSECCRFGLTGREPQVTAVEQSLLLQALRARGGPLSKKRRALPISLQFAAHERVCPLLEQPGKCAVYAARPLGCRTYFCARADLPTRPDRKVLQAIVRDLQTIALSYAADGDKPRALTSALAALKV